MASQKKSFMAPDSSNSVEKGKIDVVTVGGVTLARGVAEPGWKWSKHGKPLMQTDSCQLQHAGWVVSGKMKYAMDDGTEMEFGPGDAFGISPGHDAWVQGDEPFEYVEIVLPGRTTPSRS